MSVLDDAWGQDVTPEMLALVPHAERVAWDLVVERGHEPAGRAGGHPGWGAAWDALYEPGGGVVRMLVLTDLEVQVGRRCSRDPALQAAVVEILVAGSPTMPSRS